MFISITRLRLRLWFFLPSFFIASSGIVKQAKEAAGFVEGATFLDRKLTFWTVTLWREDAAMKAFRGQGAHKESMPKFANWCDEGSVAHWESEEGLLPDLGEINRQMKALGRPSLPSRRSEGDWRFTFPTSLPAPYEIGGLGSTSAEPCAGRQSVKSPYCHRG